MDLMEGRRGLVMGVANDHSIAWGIARALAAQGAELAFTYQGETLGRRVRPLVQTLGSSLVMPCDVEDLASLDTTFAALDQVWPEGLDFVVHAVGFSDKAQLKGRYVDVTTRENFSRTMVISCFSFTELAQRAAKRMRPGGSLLTLTYGGATRVKPNYNVMGLAKAALEASVRYLATDLGPQNIRVNGLSAGPVRSLAGAGIADARQIFNHQAAYAPLRRNATLNDIGGSALYLLSSLSGGVTGEIHFVDGGYNIIAMPRPDVLQAQDAAGVMDV